MRKNKSEKKKEELDIKKKKKVMDSKKKKVIDENEHIIDDNESVMYDNESVMDDDESVMDESVMDDDEQVMDDDKPVMKMKDKKKINKSTLNMSFSLETPEKTKSKCDDISKKSSNYKCVYDEKTNICYVDMSSLLEKTIDILGDNLKLSESSSNVKEFLSKIEYPDNDVDVYNNNNNKKFKIIFINNNEFDNSMESEEDMNLKILEDNIRSRMRFYGGHNRKIYSSQGEITSERQGGQQFIYPTHVETIVGGKKKTLRKHMFS